VTPRRDRTFGCVKRFHTTASWQKICILLAMVGKGSEGGRMHFYSLLWIVTSVRPYTFDANS